ncbi:MAG TPA: endolytic transglycosylase MltG [Casimicrobiaceae bacterium]|nr:endolytic transglycosylase MltG [Casimicrobiaceae bacterium]
MRRAFLLFLGFFLIAAGSLTALAWYWYRTPLALPRAPFDFEVRSGATLGAVARQLNAAGVVPHPVALIALGRLESVDRSIKAGSYEIEAGITLPQLLAKLTQGDVTQTSLTIVEGATFAELKRALRDNPQVVKSVIDLPDAELLARLGAREPHPEGLFFPDTYFFAAGSTDLAILKRAHAALETRLAAAWDKRARDLPLATPYEALILASIVEKETGRPADRPLVASVFINRLRHNMRLQTDPTVIYGLGERFDGNLRKRDLEADSRYNTYTRDGLPPTPIALPSQASLDAVTQPPATEYLFFVSRGDGTSEFSASLADHNRAVAKYQRGAR